MKNQFNVDLAANIFGAFFVGPFEPGTVIKSVEGVWISTLGQVLIGKFTNKLTVATAAAFSAAGSFFSPSSLVLPTSTTGLSISWPIGDVVSATFPWIGIGLTGGPATGIKANIGVVFDLVSLPAGSGGTIPTGGTFPPTTKPRSRLPHSPGFYGWHPGPG